MMTRRLRLNVCIPDALLFSWDSQANQYHAFDVADTVVYERHYAPDDKPSGTPVDCLLYYDRQGTLAGILNHYPTTCDLEDAGNVNVWVRPDAQRQGIGRRLIADAARRWTLDPAQQRYTRAGAMWTKALLTGEEL